MPYTVVKRLYGDVKGRVDEAVVVGAKLAGDVVAVGSRAHCRLTGVVCCSDGGAWEGSYEV